MKLNKIPMTDQKLVNVIIETPAGSRNKYNYDPVTDMFRLKKILPLGMSFPFDFGFIPNTLAGDGDPLDVLVLMDEPAFPGCLVGCRMIGIVEAEQAEKGRKKMRNDRLVAVAGISAIFADVTDIKDLGKQMITELEQFFVNYNELEGKNFKLLRRAGTAAAMKMIKTLAVR